LLEVVMFCLHRLDHFSMHPVNSALPSKCLHGTLLSASTLSANCHQTDAFTNSLIVIRAGRMIAIS
jgi:hypothetical protein